MAKIKTFYSVLFLIYAVSVLLSWHICEAQPFFIDLESLGFTSSGNEGEEQASSSVLVAQPSEPQYVEVDSKSEPGKSVKLTIEELKALILGSVKEITSKPQPINIKISTEGRGRAPPPLPSPSTTQAPAPPPSPTQKYKYKSVPSTSDFSHGASEVDEHYYKNYERAPVSVEYDTPDYDSRDHFSNEVNPVPKSPSKVKESSESGLMSVYKTVLKSPTYIMNTYSSQLNRWRGKKQPPALKMKPQRRPPLADITYHPRDRRRRRKQKPMRRPNQRRRPRPRPLRRRQHHQQRPSSIYSDYDYADSEYESYRRGGGGGYGDAWDRMDAVGESGSGFDSTIPSDDTQAMNMSPPKPYF